MHDGVLLLARELAGVRFSPLAAALVQVDSLRRHQRPSESAEWRMNADGLLVRAWVLCEVGGIDASQERDQQVTLAVELSLMLPCPLSRLPALRGPCLAISLLLR